MLFIGLVLVILALVTIGYMWFGTAGLDPVEVDLGAFTMTLSPLWIFLLGAASVLVLAIGSALLVAGLRRRQRQRRELRELRRKAEVLERDRRRPEDTPVPPRDTRPAPDAENRTGDRLVRDDAPPTTRDPHGGEDAIHLPGDRRRTTEQ